MKITFTEAERTIACGIFTEENVSKPTLEWEQKLMATITAAFEQNFESTVDDVLADWKASEQMPYQLKEGL